MSSAAPTPTIVLTRPDPLIDPLGLIVMPAIRNGGLSDIDASLWATATSQQRQAMRDQARAAGEVSGLQTPLGADLVMAALDVFWPEDPTTRQAAARLFESWLQGARFHTQTPLGIYDCVPLRDDGTTVSAAPAVMGPIARSAGFIVMVRQMLQPEEPGTDIRQVFERAGAAAALEAIIGPGERLPAYVLIASHRRLPSGGYGNAVSLSVVRTIRDALWQNRVRDLWFIPNGPFGPGSLACAAWIVNVLALA